MLRSEIVRRILTARGIAGADLEAFLSPTIDRRAAPEALPGVVEAVDEMLVAVAGRRKIVVFGDYDCDGVCATAIMTRALSALGADVEPFLPDRMTEGYGMSDVSVERMLCAHPGVGLVVTVDNGINSVKQVADLRSRGIGVVVTDHHLPGEELPAANALVNPKVDAPRFLDGLCGAGVAVLIAERLISEAKRRGVCGEQRVAGPLLVLAGLATVTDVVPLLGQNRILVAEALKKFDGWAPAGLRELYLRAARRGADRHTTRDFSHCIGPRMNAAGRMASGMDALELVLANDREKARELAMKVDEYNFKRKEEEQKMTDAAMAKVVPGAAAQVIDMPDGHPGVAGIVAARVMERLGENAPVCVIAGGHGSARSPERINIRDALAACGDALTTYGGHAAAAGFSVKPGRMDDFRRLLCDYCERCGAGEHPSPTVDAWLEPSDVTLDLAEELQCLEPFGEGNPEPVFGMRNVVFSDVKPVGADGRHLGIVLRDGGLRAVFWNGGEQVERLRAKAGPHTLRFHVVVSTYQDRHAELSLLSVDSGGALQ